MRLSGWGNYPVIDTTRYTVPDYRALKTLLAGGFNGITHAMGRSYGDSALAESTLSTARLDHLLAFDADTGRLTCEAGVSLAELIEIFLPRGWFLPVTPGTRYVSVGGAIASDVHGKNHHHDGCFSDYVDELKLMLADGSIVACSPKRNPELFLATCGGMGLTGVILEATFRLKPVQSAFIEETIRKAENLDQVMDLFEQYQDASYSVAWLDCLAGGNQLGRSLLMLGEHSKERKLTKWNKKPLSVPFSMPDFLLNRYSIKVFNTLYYGRIPAKEKKHTVHLHTFFYPLDGLLHWNRLYGRSGFLQYQFVLPKERGKEGLKKILTRINESRNGSFLSVLKLFGKENKNYLQFPMEGYTLALDFKMVSGLPDFLQELDRIVVDYGGRLYLTKDARMSEQTFKKGYPDWEKLAGVRSRTGADKHFNSLQSKRLGL